MSLAENKIERESADEFFKAQAALAEAEYGFDTFGQRVHTVSRGGHE